ncbi:Metallo-hydrolase/oxidoreductase [Crucibulum laeve]|uniref:Metallo-hydrolase/oxidoreductase n=1 Tax=Crucibulum laeve TaxID=68775 RepID=A0A5C3M5H2_9AGAR|nr:Metallo-hydrolase/oxidoreductase [Crucibulum laeve]
MQLPLPSPNQHYCNISALEAGLINLPDVMFINNADPTHVTTAPSLSFLLIHSANHQKFIFDLGIRQDWENYTPAVVRWIKKTYKIDVKQDVAQSLQKGGTSPADITTVCLSHCHWDHVGDTSPFTNSVFVLGGDSQQLFNPGYPVESNSFFSSDLLPLGRTNFLSVADWQPIGPFPRALDFYGDGSLYIIDAPGHLPGHINLLARTSPDGAWIYLAGDSAHHWNLLNGASDIAVGHPGHLHSCAHVNKEQAEEHIARIKELLNMPRVRVMLAHDGPWFRENHGGAQFWPGKIQSL